MKHLQRNRRVSFRVSSEEHKALKYEASQRGISVTELMRLRIFDDALPAKPNAPTMHPQAQRDIHKLNYELQQFLTSVEHEQAYAENKQLHVGSITNASHRLAITKMQDKSRAFLAISVSLSRLYPCTENKAINKQ